MSSKYLFSSALERSGNQPKIPVQMPTMSSLGHHSFPCHACPLGEGCPRSLQSVGTKLCVEQRAEQGLDRRSSTQQQWWSRWFQHLPDMCCSRKLLEDSSSVTHSHANQPGQTQSPVLEADTHRLLQPSRTACGWEPPHSRPDIPICPPKSAIRNGHRGITCLHLQQSWTASITSFLYSKAEQLPLRGGRCP